MAAESGNLTDDKYLAKELSRRPLRRIMLRASCTRIAADDTWPFVRRVLVDRLLEDVRGIVAHAQLAQVKTITEEHAKNYYKGIGRRIYGALPERKPRS
jgi:hypothetical protein